jgi:hypothetical protein
MKDLITLIIFAIIIYSGLLIESSLVNVIMQDLGADTPRYIYYVSWAILAVSTWVPLLYIAVTISTLIYIILDKNNY